MLPVLGNLIPLFTKSNTVVSVAQPFPKAAPFPLHFAGFVDEGTAMKCSLRHAHVISKCSWWHICTVPPWQSSQHKDTALTPGCPLLTMQQSSGTHWPQEWAQDCSALQFCKKKSLDFNPVTCDNQQHLQKKKKKNEHRKKEKTHTV